MKPMTIVRRRAARTSWIVPWLICFLAACSSPKQRIYLVGDDAAAFCVPAELDITPGRQHRPATVPTGFLLRGCFETNEACVGPRSVPALAISSTNAFPGVRLGDYEGTTHIASTAIARFEHAISVAPRLIAIPDRGDDSLWYLWGAEGEIQSSLPPNAVLEAICRGDGSRFRFSCSRKVKPGEYWLSYHFFSDHMPTSFKERDRDAIAAVEALRCP